MIAPQFLRANPRLRGRGVPYVYGIGEGISAFEALIAQATIVGSSVLCRLTNVRTNGRKSVIDGTDVAANTPDLRLVNGLFVESSLKGDENLVTPDMTVGAWVQSQQL